MATGIGPVHCMIKVDNYTCPTRVRPYLKIKKFPQIKLCGLPQLILKSSVTYTVTHASVFIFSYNYITILVIVFTITIYPLLFKLEEKK